MVLDVDQNDNGMIEFNEFLQMMSKKMREGDSEDELKEAFKWVYELDDWIAPKVMQRVSVYPYRRSQERFILMWCFMLSLRYLSPIMLNSIRSSLRSDRKLQKLLPRGWTRDAKAS